MISKFSVKRPYTVIVGVILVIVLGVVSFTRMTTDLLPDMNLPYALVITTDVGASPEEVETDVTAPVEASMATTSSIKNVSSVSYDNYSMVILEYEQSANMDSILIEIQQKLDQLEGSFSDSVGKPMIMQIDPDMMPVMVASADVEGMDESEVSSYVENEFSPALESVEGVASVSATGVLEESVQVTMDQEKIDALNDKIQEKIEEQFADAQKELDDASAELENGEKKLESGKRELASQVSAAANQIENGKIQAYVGASELKTNMTMMTEAKKIMEKAIPALQQLYNDGIAARQQLEALKNMLTPEQQEMAPGSTLRLDAAVRPENSTTKLLTWSSSNAYVASVTDGVVTAHAAGTAVITAKSVSGGFTAACSVTVVPPAEITALSVEDMGELGLVRLTVANIPAEAAVFLAAYDRAGRLVVFRQLTLANGTAQESIPLTDAARIKAFIWEDGSLRPLAGCKALSVSQ